MTRASEVREKATHYPAALTDAELLAFIVGVTVEKAAEFLSSNGGIHTATRRPELLKPAARARMSAVVEMAARLAKSSEVERTPLAHPAAVASYLALRYARMDQEVMGALYLDTRHRLILDCELYRGTLNRAAVEPRAILRAGLEVGALGIVLFHTHPSGDPSPSAEDLAFTRRLAEAGEVVGIRLVDHLIVAGVGRWVSLRERGAW